jgi:hypothetical protein
LRFFPNGRWGIALAWIYSAPWPEFGPPFRPTFFVNGKVLRGALPFEEFEKEIAPHLQG